MCFSACQTSLQPRFNDTGPDASALAQSCLSRLRSISLYLCLELYCGGDHQTEGLSSLNRTCVDGVGSPLPSFDVLANYTDEVVSRLRHLEREEAVYTAVLGEVVIPSETLFALSYRTHDAVVYVEKYHYRYSAAMFIFWSAVVVMGMSNRLASYMGNVQPSKYPALSGGEHFDSDETTGVPAYPSRLHVWLARHLTYPATFGYRCSQNVGWCTIPPRVQSLTILAFIIINIVFCIHGYRVFPGNMYWPEVSTQLWRYVSDRTGIISFANFPIIWIFGMRNNLLMWLTGWDFATYNNFHRWIARVATLQAVVHSIGYTVLVFKNGGWPYFVAYWEQMFWWAGELATICMCLLLGLSVFWMRRNSYEAFLVIHIVLSILILVLMLGHVSIFNGRFDGPIWACIFIWVSDRVLRVSRILLFNPRFWNTRATATYDPASDIIRLAIPYSTSAYQPKPGTYYYLHVINDIRFWESHPFTVASTTPRDQYSLDAQEVDTGEVLLLLRDEPCTTCATTSCGQCRRKPRATMTFLVRPYDSFTRRLRNTAAAAWGGSASLRVLVDGPYGRTQRLGRFDNVLFIVGGSGIVVPLSYLEYLTKPKSRVKTVRIVWAARESEFAAEVMREDVGHAFNGGKVSLDVYITKDEGSSGHNQPANWPSEVRVLSDRPDVFAEVECATRDVEGGSLAVMACGPARMADDARRAVVNMLGRRQCSVEYFEETFRW